MISQMTTITMTDRPVAAACSLDVSMVDVLMRNLDMRDAAVRGTGLSVSAALLPVLPARERSERPTGAPAVAAAKAQASAYAFAAAANGAGATSAHAGGTADGSGIANGNGQQKKTQQHGKWAFRGLEPWSDPA
jgi:hypothetical protein